MGSRNRPWMAGPSRAERSAKTAHERQRVHVALGEMARELAAGADPLDVDEPARAWVMPRPPADPDEVPEPGHRRLRHWKLRAWKRRSAERHRRALIEREVADHPVTAADLGPVSDPPDGLDSAA